MKKLYTSALILAVAFSACQEETLQPLSEPFDDVMRFDPVAPGAQTKATGSAFETSDVIGLYVTDWVDDKTPMPLQISGNRANNMPLTFDGTAWTPKRALYWGEGKSDVYAVYPYIEGVADINSQLFAVAADQTTAGDGGNLGGYEASDLLWAKAEGESRRDGAVKLAMKHIMSKLTVKIVAGEDYVGSLPDDASVLLHSTVAAARVDFETGAVVKDPYSGAQSIEMKKLGLRATGGVEAVVYEAVVVPQMLETSVPLLEINSKSVSYLLEDSFNFRAGVAYTYTVTLNTSTNAIRVDIGCELEDWNSTGGDDNDDSEDDGSDEGDDGVDYEDLSEEGTANCYIVSEAGDYKFKAVQGNLDATVGNVKTVEVLWESFGTDVRPQVGDLIASASYRNGYVRFSTAKRFSEGNAVIAARSSEGDILWSWHIWLTDQPEIQVYNHKAGFMLDRNLGATSAEPGDAGSLGLLYQWGRKDPFLSSSSIAESIEAASTGEWYVKKPEVYDLLDLSEKNPTTLYAGHWEYSFGVWRAEKTSFDPCPVGWMVPDGGNNGFWAKAGVVSTPFDRENMGMNFHLYHPDLAWYPAAGIRKWDTGELEYVGAVGAYWTLLDNHTMMLFMHNERLNHESYGYNNGDIDISPYKSAAIPVRCCREYDESLVPDVVIPDFSTSAAVDLSSDGTANCYVVSSEGTYAFPTVKGNSSQSIGDVATAYVVWESFGTDETPAKGDLVYAAKYEGDKIYFKTADKFREGNALIAAADVNGKILWSWHIWLTDRPKEQVYYNDAGSMMDRNIGATSADPEDLDAMGLTYQWGRKDPFMGWLMTDSSKPFASTYLWPSDVAGNSEIGTIEYAIAHPTTLINGYYSNDWCYTIAGKSDYTRWQSEKTIYDPCPAGWRVPDGGPEGILAKATGGFADIYASDGSNFSGVLGNDETIYYPGFNDGSWSVYWTCTPYSELESIVYCLNSGPWGYVNQNYYVNPSGRNYIRCQKEESR